MNINVCVTISFISSYCYLWWSSIRESSKEPKSIIRFQTVSKLTVVSSEIGDGKLGINQLLAPNDRQYSETGMGEGLFIASETAPINGHRQSRVPFVVDGLAIKSLKGEVGCGSHHVSYSGGRARQVLSVNKIL